MDSAERKLRLQALRLEASRLAAASHPAGPARASCLSSAPAIAPPALPLPQFADSPPAPAVAPPVLPLPQFADSPVLDSPPPVRFDFYTDPMAAFSANKRIRGARSAGYSPSFPSRPPSPSLPSFHPLPPSPSSFPVGIRNNHVDRSYPSVSQFQPPDLGSYGPPSRFPHNSPMRSPMQSRTPFPGNQGSLASCPARQGFPQYTPSNNLASAHVFRGQSPMGYAGRSGSHSISGRGRGRHFSGGRGGHFKNKASTQSNSGSYFSNSMLQDPWCDLQPVVGNILEPRAGSGYWLPESLAPKKSKVSEPRSSNPLNSKSSLSEFLASSLDEVINEGD